MRIAIGVSSFAESDPLPKQILENRGFEVIDNPYHRRMTEDEVIAHVYETGAVGLIAGLEPLTDRVLSRCPELRAIARVGVGMDTVDQNACMRYRIKVSNTPDGPTEAVAEATLAALLCLTRKFISMNQTMHAGKWHRELGLSLKGLKVLVVGLGRIGKRVCVHLSHMGCNVKGFDPIIKSDFVSLADGLPWAEVVTLHASGTDTLLGENEFALMRDGVILLNCARGGLLDEYALIRNIQSGKIARCWLDVYGTEPYSGILKDFPQVLMTPHVSSLTRQCRVSMELEAVKNLLRDLELPA